MDSNDLGDIDEELDDNQRETKIVFTNNVLKNDHKLTEEELHSLYLSFDVDFNQINRTYSLWRLEVIHIRGVQDMSSEDVLKYFEDFEPNSIEWVNDLSCNVVFSDPKAAAIAMKGLTTALVVKISKHPVNSDLGIQVIDSDSLSVPIPPQYRWRLGKTVHKSKALLLRFATNKDKKIIGSRPVSQHFNKYEKSVGICDTTTTDRKRRYKFNESEPSAHEITDGSDLKTKRFRMRADDEQQLIQNRKTTKMRIIKEDTKSGRKSIWDRLDNDSFGNYCAVDTDLLQIAFDNKTNSRKIWNNSRIRSTVSITKSDDKLISDKNDLRTKLRKKSL